VAGVVLPVEHVLQHFSSIPPQQVALELGEVIVAEEFVQGESFYLPAC